MYKVLVAEPIYHAVPPAVYHNRIIMWRTTFRNEIGEEPNELDTDSFLLGQTYSRIVKYRARPYTIGPRENIRTARDKAIRVALQENATHLFFLDDDILTPPAIIPALLALDKPIVGALVHRDNGDPLVWREPRASDPIAGIQAYLNSDADIGEILWRDHPKTGVFECAATAVGCMMIKVEVIQSLNDTRWVFNYDETERSMGVRFCRFAQKHGWTVWCAPDVLCKQVQHY
jgi:hypothetical protein